MRVRAMHLCAAVACLVLATGLMGCDNVKPELVTAWPVATTERVVPEPPVPPRWPYTGKDAPSEKAVNRRVMSIKIENSNPARPQIGLNSADVVYETVVEGGITRYNCIFHSKVPKQVGPVRSARLSDQWIVPQYDGILFFSGRSHDVGVVLKNKDIPSLEHGRIPAAYFRVSNRNAPHNLLIDTKKAMSEAKRKDFRVTSESKPLSFDRRSVDTTPNVERVDIPFSMANKVYWKYDEDSKKWKRWNNGAVHRDAATGKQVNADNVVVMWATYTQATRDKHGGMTWDIDMGGEGKVAVFKDGRRYNGTWKADRTTPPTFWDENGDEIKLKAGRTWFQVVPTDVKIKVTKAD